MVSGVKVIHEIMKVIHSVQHPQLLQPNTHPDSDSSAYTSNNLCANRRLLVLNMKSNTFEGSGSLVKQFMIALAQALHSNRTLVWGLGLPHLYAHSRYLWAGENRHRIDVNGIELDCSSADEFHVILTVPTMMFVCEKIS
jgi:hypothetical protein